ncbi:uncharacterized protein LOC121372917 [Gigantopelta aegis]|uniref:uncharacterized protein LOC121372917 n=1 Tax=Gigantopelta aegis TaxID=1735272 RepID=UPI001B88C1EB|nr:uncharacterized protein LOC121372917 [Gigantopelta aegis]
MPNIPEPLSTASSTTRSRSQKAIHDTVYSEQCELPTGKLPTEKDIVCCMVYLLRPDRAGKALRTLEEAATLMPNAFIEHWHVCNVYTIGERHIVKKICALYNEFKGNFQTRNERKTEKWKEKMSAYNKRVQCTLFDISTQDIQRTKRLEEQYGVKMTLSEHAILEDQKGAMIGYWEQTTQRRHEDQLTYENMKKEEETSQSEAISWDHVVS